MKDETASGLGGLRSRISRRLADSQFSAILQRFCQRGRAITSHPLVMRTFVFLSWLVIVGMLAFAGLILALRYLVLPNLDSHRERIEQMVSQRLGQPVHIGSISAGWDGLKPDLTLRDVLVGYHGNSSTATAVQPGGVTSSSTPALDQEAVPALSFSRVEAVIDWSSLIHFQLRLDLLEVDAPILHIRRDTQGQLTIAGMPVPADSTDSSAADWVLAQKHIRINGASLVWDDEKREAPTLILKDVNFSFDNHWRSHRFGFTALPPAKLASRIDIRGDLYGRHLSKLDEWSGQLFTDFAFVDMAAWQKWFDLPAALPRVRGAVRTWLNVTKGRVFDVTIDAALEDVRFQAMHDLPELHLSALRGRFGLRLREGGFLATAHQVSFKLADGSQVPSTDLSIDWQRTGVARVVDAGQLEGGASTTPAVKSAQAAITASRLDLQRIRRLAEFLPVDPAIRHQLEMYAPSGELKDVHITFTGDATHVSAYSLRTAFSRLSLHPHGNVPGFSGFAGTVDANENGGQVDLRAKSAEVDLPAVFSESKIAFDTLAAQVRWKIDKKRTSIELQKVEFANADAAGVAKGSYVYSGKGMGVVDLTANLSRVRSDAVWRYLPMVVNAEARDWVHRGIGLGTASDAKLTLKGDLGRFPFVDGSGTFLVTAKAHDVSIDYIHGWPKLEHVNGELRFAGAGMRVEASSGTLLGTKISRTVVEIPDFHAANKLLTVRGKVDGPVDDFFKYINTGPLGEKLANATADMSGSGSGSLDLSLQIPLSTPENTRVKGDFVFKDNQLVIDPALPPLTSVKGMLSFTDNSLAIRDINGQFLGGPVNVRADTQNGMLGVLATGYLEFAQAAKRYNLPVFDHLSGSSAWKASVKVKKGVVTVAVDSDLVGVASNLPAPFGKTAAEIMPLHFEKGLAVARVKKSDERDRIQIALGSQGQYATAQLLRRHDAAGAWVPERGVLAVGTQAALPDKGVSIVVSTPEFNADYWRVALASRDADKGGNATGKKEQGGAVNSAATAGATDSVSNALMPDFVRLKTQKFTVLGRQHHDVDLRATRSGNSWSANISSRETTGDIYYESGGRGAVRARFKNFIAGGDPEQVSESQTLEDLPALDIIAETVTIGKKKLGRLEMLAVNSAASWSIEKLAIINNEGRLDGSGKWSMAEPQRFNLDFKLESADVGALLARVGYPGSVKRGTATLGGKLEWKGSPAHIDFPSLTGSLNLHAAKGQFAKIDPGAAGKLLGLISLQGIPRRITLDFNDVFSEGFAFDSIRSKLDVKAGVMYTDRLQIDGPSARVVMRGKIDLKNETQDLRVNIQPELGGTAAIGVAIINPIAGAATLLAHKVLQNPLNHIFSFNYGITGKWDDPKVERISQQRPATEPENGGGATDDHQP